MKEERAERQQSALVSSDLQHRATEQHIAQTDNTQLQWPEQLEDAPEFQVGWNQSKESVKQSSRHWIK